METLKNTKKITLATLKAFAKRNKNNLFAKTESSFDGMVDCVVSTIDKFNETKMTNKTGYFKTGIQGIYTVGSSRDYFELYNDNNYFGIEVSNSCGTSILAIRK